MKKLFENPITWGVIAVVVLAIIGYNNGWFKGANGNGNGNEGSRRGNGGSTLRPKRGCYCGDQYMGAFPHDVECPRCTPKDEFV